MGRLRLLSWIQLWNQECAVVGSLTGVTVACYSFLVHVKGEFIRGDVEHEKPHFSMACGRWGRALQGMDERAPLGSAWFRFVFESNSSPANLVKICQGIQADDAAQQVCYAKPHLTLRLW